MVECLDDLNAADVLDNGGVHLVRCPHRPFVFFLVVAHDDRHKDHADGNRDEREQRHAPVEDEQIDEDAQGAKCICCHLRP